MDFESALKSLLKFEEGVRAIPYTDTVGKLTIGVGRNLSDVGLSDDEIDYLLSTDVARVLSAAREYDWFDHLSVVRQVVICSMIFQLGAAGFSKFVTLISCLQDEDWPGAAGSMLASKWAKQTPQRAERAAWMMVHDKFFEAATD